MSTIRHILVGTDFSEASHSAVGEALDLARVLGARLTVLHVHSPGMQALGAAGLEETMAIGRDVHEALARVRDRLTGVSDSKIDVIPDPSPATAILDYAQSHGVDLIVVGSHGYGAARRFLLGSVADRLARHASCSVLIARPPKSTRTE